MARIDRCEAMIWDNALQTLMRGLPVILDLGFTKAAHRQKFTEMAREHGADAVLHWVDVPAEERWARVQTRNTERGETFAMTVTRELFDFMEGEWDAPTGEAHQTVT